MRLRFYRRSGWFCWWDQLYWESDHPQQRAFSLHRIDLGGDVTDDGISKLVFTILSAVAEAERERIRDRVREVKRDQRERARYLGGNVPFGWRRVAEEKGFRLEPIDEEQAAIGRMIELRRVPEAEDEVAVKAGQTE